MKYALIALLISLPVFSQVTPDYLKDATITVKLKNGKEYTYSANEYAVIKRGAKRIELADNSPVQIERSAPTAEVQAKRHKHIISGEIIRSNSGRLETNSGSSTIDVEGKKELGLGLQYQYNFVDDLYLGGRIDTNGGAGVSVGVGF